MTTYDSAQNHMPRIGDAFALIVFDECHHLPGELRQDAARMCAALFRLGLTATPERSDGRQTLLDRLIGPVVYRQSLAKARGHTLTQYEVHRIAVHLSQRECVRYDELSQTIRQHMYERRQVDPTYTWQQLCSDSGRDPAARRSLRAFHAKGAIEDRAEEKLRVLEDLFRLHVGEPCLIFTGTNAMARDVSRRFLIPCLLSHCGKRERLDVLQGLENATLRSSPIACWMKASICPTSRLRSSSAEAAGGWVLPGLGRGAARGLESGAGDGVAASGAVCSHA